MCEPKEAARGIEPAVAARSGTEAAGGRVSVRLGEPAPHWQVDRPKGVAGDDLRLVAKHFVPHDHVAAANEGRRGCPVVLDARSHLGQCGGEDIAPPTDHSVVEDHLVRVAVEQAVVARLLVHRVHAVRTKIER